jgi:hypothetical protein
VISGVQVLTGVPCQAEGCSTYFFASHAAAVAFIAAVATIAEPGWTVTPAARPTYQDWQDNSAV